VTRPPESVEATTRPCDVCNRALDDTEPQTCYRCYQRARTLLADVVALYAELPDIIGHLAAIKTSTMPAEKYPSPSMPGGDALVMLGPGSDGRREDSFTFRDGDAYSVSAILGSWEDAWRVQRAEPAALYRPSVRTASAYLRGHLQWASNTAVGFSDFIDDLSRLKGRMRVVTGQISPPVKSDARCFADNCEGRLEQRWRDDGLDEDRDCPDCGAHYTFSQYLLALKAHLEQQNAVIDAPMAAHIFGIDANTLNVWEHRDKIKHVERDEKGRKRYRFRDVAELMKEPRHARAS